METWGLLTKIPSFLRISMIVFGQGFSPFAFMPAATRLISAILLIPWSAPFLTAGILGQASWRRGS